MKKKLPIYGQGDAMASAFVSPLMMKSAGESCSTSFKPGGYAFNGFGKEEKG